MEETDYYNQIVRNKHPEVKDEWVAQILDQPDHTETRFVNGEHRKVLFGYVDEIERWVVVVLTEGGRLLNRHIDRRAMRRWGRP